MFKGVSGTILAYGHTATGKSYSMEGPSTMSYDNTTLMRERDQYRGIVPRSIEHIFAKLATIRS
jgi:hypothetical protein